MAAFTPAEAVRLAEQEVEARYRYGDSRFSSNAAERKLARESWEPLYAQLQACIKQFDGTATLDKMRDAARKSDVRARSERDLRDQRAAEQERIRGARERALEEVLRERLGGRP